ncbi:hypothetical protein ABZY34_28500 [Streptomyces virginiae]|uniref:hypothetical protein n=1 Tax=Streptomyces virginiae TaxID=1961 RepID=UPI0033B815FE
MEQTAFGTVLIAAAMSSSDRDFSERTHSGFEIIMLTSRFDVSHRNLRLLRSADGHTCGFADEIRLSHERGPAYSGRTLKGGDPGNV